MSYTDPSVDGTPVPGGKIVSAWGDDVQTDIEYFKAGPTITAKNAYTDPILDLTAGGTDRFRFGRFSGSPGATRFGIFGDAAAPAIILMECPTVSGGYLDVTYDGNNAEWDLSQGNLSVRALGNGTTVGGNPGNWMQTYSLSYQAGFRVGNTGGTKFLNLWCDGADGYMSTDIGDVQLLPFSGFVDFHNCPTATSCTGGSHPLPANASGFFGVKVQGFQFFVPYYAA